jgi:hypothetical protein
MTDKIIVTGLCLDPTGGKCEIICQGNGEFQEYFDNNIRNIGDKLFFTASKEIYGRRGEVDDAQWVLIIEPRCVSGIIDYYETRGWEHPENKYELTFDYDKKKLYVKFINEKI